MRLSNFEITNDLYGFRFQLPLFMRTILCSWKSEKARSGDGTISVRSPIQFDPLFDSELSLDTSTMSTGFRCWTYVAIGRLMPPISKIVFGSDSSSVSQMMVVMPRDWIDDVCCTVVISICAVCCELRSSVSYRFHFKLLDLIIILRKCFNRVYVSFVFLLFSE